MHRMYDITIVQLILQCNPYSILWLSSFNVKCLHGLCKDHWGRAEACTACCYRHHFCVQVSQETIDEKGGTSHEPTSRRITVEAEAGATKKLKYHVPVSGTEKDDRSFLIECHLSGSTSMLPQKKFNINYNDQCLPFSLTGMTAASTSEASSHVTVTSTSGTSPGKPIVIDFLNIVINMLHY